MKRVWAFDIDGVVADTYTALKYIIEKEYNCYFDVMPYCPNKIYSNISDNHFYKILEVLFKEGKIKPFYDAINIINKYHRKYERIVFITHRNPKLILYTYSWLNKYFNFDYELYQGYENKVQIAKENDIIGIIDDKPFICKKFLNNNLDAICHKQPFNKYEDLKGLCVMDWQEIENILLY